MRFTFVDRVLDLQPGVKITTVKCLTLGEEYLADHFPRFAVLPGVLMLEAMAEAGAWLVRITEDFAHSMVLLKEARNIKYADFVQPGQTLTITAEILKHEERETQLKTQGVVDGKVAVSGRLSLERYNLAQGGPEASDPRVGRADLATTDELLKRYLRAQWSLLGGTVSRAPAEAAAAK